MTYVCSYGPGCIIYTDTDVLECKLCNTDKSLMYLNKDKAQKGTKKRSTLLALTRVRISLSLRACSPANGLHKPSVFFGAKI